MKARHLLAFLLTTFGAHAAAADPCPPTDRKAEWSATCFQRKGAERRVKPAYMKKLKLNRHGMATILIANPRELVAVNRRGDVIIPNIQHTGDFDTPHAGSSMGRFLVHRKTSSGHVRRQCGYFLAGSFRIVAPARFDHCLPFKEGLAFACAGCSAYCTETECQHRVLVGGVGFGLGKDGKIKKKFPLPTRDSICGNQEAAQIDELASGAVMLSCRDGADGPFGKP